MKASMFRRWVALPVIAIAAQVSAPAAYATHSWAGYHWARTVNPFTLKLGDNLSGPWAPYLVTTSRDWSASTVLDTTIVAGASNKRCTATAGKVEVCNSAYGRNGWLGIASVWASGNHITQGTVKMNDTYFSMASYDTLEWRNFVMCQEVGHTLGLDHQDEVFDNANLGTCMDYTNNPMTNQHPNQHDYDELVTIYSHPDSTTTLAQTAAPAPGNPSAADVHGQEEWGQVARYGVDGRPVLYVRVLGPAEKVFTWVTWAHERDR